MVFPLTMSIWLERRHVLEHNKKMKIYVSTITIRVLMVVGRQLPETVHVYLFEIYV